MRARGLMAAALAVLIGAAAPAGAQEAAPGLPGDWRVTRLGAADIHPDDDVTLVLSEDRASGRTGCNRFTGAYSAEDTAVSLGPLAMTRMACFGRAAEVETWFVQVLGAVDGWRRDGGALELLDGTLPVLRALPAGDDTP